MSLKASLTDARIKALPFTESGQRFYPDLFPPGFGVRVSTRSKSFVLVIGKARQRLTLGTYGIIGLADARQKALKILRDRELGISHRPTPLFGDVYREYMATRDHVRPATRRADKYLLKPFLALAKERIGSIEPRDLEKIMEGMPPVTRLHAFSNVRNVFRFAVRRGYVERNPTDKLDTPKGNQPRERVLTQDELQRVLVMAQQYGYPFGIIIQLLICTGARRQMIGSLQRDWIDLNNLLISWPPEAMKGRKRHSVPITARVADLITKIPGHSSQLLFVSSAGTPFSAWSQHMREFRRDCGLAEHWTCHDLRRSCATIHAQLGTPLHVVEKLLSHSLSQLTPVGAIYQRYDFLREAREACQKYEDFLSSLVGNSAD